MIVVGEREFRSLALADWLDQQDVGFALRQKKGTYIQQEGQAYQTLQCFSLAPGMKLYLTGIKVTKQQGVGSFDIAAYWQQKYEGVVPGEG